MEGCQYRVLRPSNTIPLCLPIKVIRSLNRLLLPSAVVLDSLLPKASSLVEVNLLQVMSSVPNSVSFGMRPHRHQHNSTEDDVAAKEMEAMVDKGDWGLPQHELLIGHICPYGLERVKVDCKQSQIALRTSIPLSLLHKLVNCLLLPRDTGRYLSHKALNTICIECRTSFSSF